MRISNETIENKISYWLLICFMATLPFHSFYSQVSLAVFALHSLFHLRKEYFRRVFSIHTLVISGIYLVVVLSILYSNDKKEGLRIAGKQSALLIIPVVFALSGFNFKKYIKHLLGAFAFSCSAVIVYLFISSCILLKQADLPVSFLFSPAMMNHNFSQSAGIHATYLSMYVALSLCIFTWFFLKEQGKRSKILYSAGIIILLAGMLMLASRAVSVTLLFIVSTGVPYFLLTGKKRRIFLAAAVCITALAFFAIFNIDAFKERYINSFAEDLSSRISEPEGLEPRWVRWKAISELIVKKPFIGYGSGSETQLLQDLYYQQKLYISYLNEFNTHSQYLAILLTAGILGIAVYLAALIYALRMAFLHRSFVFASFVIIVAGASVSENILDLNKGIFFYATFFSLFLSAERISNPDNSNSV